MDTIIEKTGLTPMRLKGYANARVEYVGKDRVEIQDCIKKLQAYIESNAGHPNTMEESIGMMMALQELDAELEEQAARLELRTNLRARFKHVMGEFGRLSEGSTDTLTYLAEIEKMWDSFDKEEA